MTDVAESARVEIEAPDITAYAAGNSGIPYVWRFEADRPGPSVAIVAVTHGNEICGAVVLDELLREGVRPSRGRLVLAFANVAAYERFDPARPSASRFVDEDLNRVWSREMLDGPRKSAELRRARELRPMVDDADLLLDIHTMQQRNVPLMLAGPLAKGRDLACRLRYPKHVICDAGHAAGRRMRDYGGFGDPVSGKNALLIECGQHWERESVDVAREMTWRFLAESGAVEPFMARGRLRRRDVTPHVIEVTEAVTIRSPDFVFTEPFAGMEVIPHRGTVIAHEADEPVTTPYDDCVLIMPTRRICPGQTAVRLGRFVAGSDRQGSDRQGETKCTSC